MNDKFVELLMAYMTDEGYFVHYTQPKITGYKRTLEGWEVSYVSTQYGEDRYNEVSSNIDFEKLFGWMWSNINELNQIRN